MVRPLIVNSTNRKTLRKLFKAVTAETLEGKTIQLYLDPNVRDPSSGEKIDGIRIRNKIPTTKTAEPIICEECGQPITPFGKFSAEDIAQRSLNAYKRKLCITCAKKAAEQVEASAQEPVELPAEQTEE